MIKFVTRQYNRINIVNVLLGYIAISIVFLTRASRDLRRGMSVLKLSPAVQQYAWGKVGSDSEVAKLFTSNSGQPVDETMPYAEVCIFNIWQMFNTQCLNIERAVTYFGMYLVD